MKHCGKSNGKCVIHGYPHVPGLAKNVVILFQEKRTYHTEESVSNAVEQLSNIPGSSRSKLSQMYCGNPNIRMWSTYMDIVNILLDFIKAQRGDHWTLRLQAMVHNILWTWNFLKRHYDSSQLLWSLTGEDVWQLHWCVHEQCDKSLQKSHNSNCGIWVVHKATWINAVTRSKVSWYEEANSQAYRW